jgi:hypothetical protein
MSQQPLWAEPCGVRLRWHREQYIFTMQRPQLIDSRGRGEPVPPAAFA